ncbi:hypothetical protein EC973_002050 [Apophysomyces ossiformis]|uniref:CUE domain-containing protein n=1 Tax=Apophysomyces ossiformis TaxID=679940 RepID=A0A8H7BIU5_9FUNG|nr:hypothetical protein EC973_002050 [Apophysomyces ossiformis]
MTEPPVTAPPLNELPGPVRTLKEAFPDIDVEVIEAILDSQRGQVEPAFEVLLGMSDPSYKPEAARQETNTRSTATTIEDAPDDDDNIPAPPMPPRPSQAALARDEQMRKDEEYAKQLALEDERIRVLQYQRGQQLRQQQQQQQHREDDEPLFNFQEEFPVIKEKVIEAGNAAKKKVMDFYNQLKAARAANMNAPSASIPTTNAQYRFQFRGLPSDDADDLLAGDMTALHLSDNDVYAQTTRRASPDSPPKVIQVNPPLSSPQRGLDAEEQIRADEALARRLAYEDQAWTRNASTPTTREGPNEVNVRQTTPPKPARRGSPEQSLVETPEIKTEQQQRQNELSPKLVVNEEKKKKEEEEEESRPYVIGDDDSEDDLVDAEEGEEEEELPEKGKEKGKGKDEVQVDRKKNASESSEKE